VIEVENVTKYYGNFRALDGITFTVQDGDVLGLLGPNGAGKTTAMRILTCFLPATSGTARVAGFDVFDDSFEVRRRLGYLPETPPVYPEMTVASYLSFVADLREVPWAEKRARIDEVIIRTALQEMVYRVIGTLSKGYRQRVGLAQAMIHNPRVLILDEPTVGLDPNQIIEIRHLIKDLAKDHTIILSTHILSEVSMTCNKAVIINDGRIVAVDTVENLQRQGEAIKYRLVIKPAARNRDWKAALETMTGLQIDPVALPDADKESGLAAAIIHLPSMDSYDEMFARLAQAGHVLTEAVPVRASLEEVFLRLTRSDDPGTDDARRVA
jgi:ABC-2 type transport system ATP-binding protein